MKNRRALLGLLFLMAGLTEGPVYAGPLTPYFLYPADLPVSCSSIPGLFPVQEKVALFYEYKVYRRSLPKLIDRHAQSFECEGQKGTLYFFAYAQNSEADAAELFARPVLTQGTPFPLIQSFPRGFVVISFANPPTSLIEALNKKINPTPSAVTTSSAPVIISSVSAPVLSSPTLPSMAQPPSVPAVVVSSPSVDLPSAGPDLADSILKTIAPEIGCDQMDLHVETRDVCRSIRDFQSGTPIYPVIGLDEARVGVAYEMDAFGQLSGRYYDILVGSGRPGEVAIFPIVPSSGLDDVEVQALIESRRAGRPFPPSNGLAARITQHGRPQRPTLFPTTGKSSTIKLAPDKQIFIRGNGKRWILLSVKGKTADQQARSGIIIVELY
jgi:hypothetical protein